MGTGFAASRSFIIRTTRSKSAPVRSILLTMARRGTRNLVRLAPHRLGLGLHAPDRAEDRHRAVENPKGTLHLDREIDVPGVSMMLIRCPRQKHVVAAEVMVMPLSCSCSIQSIVAVPSWTSPILWETPV